MGDLWQLTRLSLVADARQLGLHAVRFGLMFVLYLAVVAANVHSTATAAGLSLFHAQLLITAFYLSANAIFGFSQTITEEKEDGALGLMRLAGVSPLAILLGKTVGRLVDAALLIAVQFPFTIVAVTLGGVSMAQVGAAYGGLAAYLCLLSVVGLTASVAARNGGVAARWTALFVAFYALPPFVLMTGVWSWPGVGQAYQVVSIPQRFTVITASGFNGSVWCSSIAIALVASGCLLIFAWWNFDRLALLHAGEEGTASTGIRRRRSRRAWSRPVFWREFQFVSGGLRWMSLRLVGHLTILLAMMSVHNSVGRGFVWGALVGGLFSIFDTTWTAGRMFRDEIRERTWSGLVQTPLPLGHVAREKVLGAALGLWPSIVWPYVWIVGGLCFHPLVSFQSRCELVAGSLTIGVSVLAYLHLLVLMSLHFGWQATPLTLTICFASGWLYVVALVPWRSSTYHFRIVMFLITCCVLAGVMAWLMRRILRRLRALAESH